LPGGSEGRIDLGKELAATRVSGLPSGDLEPFLAGFLVVALLEQKPGVVESQGLVRGLAPQHGFVGAAGFRGQAQPAAKFRSQLPIVIGGRLAALLEQAKSLPKKW